MEERLLEIEGKLDKLIALLDLQVEASLQPDRTSSSVKWFNTPTAASMLGVEPDKLYSLRSSGRLGACGINWRYGNVSRKARRPTYQWQVEGCQAALSKSLAFK